MKKIMTIILAIAVAVSGITATTNTAKAAVNADGYYECESPYYTDEDGNKYYDLCEVDKTNGGAGSRVGFIAYDREGNAVYKMINGETIIDIRKSTIDKENARKVCIVQKKTGHRTFIDGAEEPVFQTATGCTVQLYCTYDDEFLTKVKYNVTWSSSNKAVATVNSKGSVKAKKVGKTVITATVLSDGLIATRTVKKTIKVVKNQYRKVTKEKQYKRIETVYYDKKGNLKYDVTMKNMSPSHPTVDYDSMFIEILDYDGMCIFDKFIEGKPVKIKPKSSKTTTYTLKKAGGKVYDLYDKCIL